MRQRRMDLQHGGFPLWRLLPQTIISISRFAKSMIVCLVCGGSRPEHWTFRQSSLMDGEKGCGRRAQSPTGQSHDNKSFK